MSERVPLRRCVVSGVVQPKSGMLRFIEVNGRVVADYSRTGSGRGVWIAASAGALERAARKNLFSKAFRRSVALESRWVDGVVQGLRAYCLHLMVKAYRAGGVSLTLGREPLICLIESPSVVADSIGSLPCFRVFSQTELDESLRPSVSVAGVRNTKLGHTLRTYLSILTKLA